MKDDKITDAIVPIYCDDMFMGTGVVYKSYLITAEHVIRLYKKEYIVNNNRCTIEAIVQKEYNNIEYEYKGERHPLKYEDTIWSRKKYGDSNVLDIINEDLAIFIIPNQSNCLSMYENDKIDGLHSDLFGFHCYNENDIKLQKREMELHDSTIWMGVHQIRQTKCCFSKKLNEKDAIIDGYSGGPILLGNKIIGMLIGHLPEGDTFHIMKSSYILKIIKQYESTSVQA